MMPPFSQSTTWQLLPGGETGEVLDAAGRAKTMPWFESTYDGIL